MENFFLRESYNIKYATDALSIQLGNRSLVIQQRRKLFIDMVYQICLLFGVSSPFRYILDAMLLLQPIRFGAKYGYLATHRFQPAGYIAAYCTFLPISASSAWFTKSSS